MCVYSIFNFVCGARKLKIVAPCTAFAINVQGLGFCHDDPVAHVDDGRNGARLFVSESFGPGICSSVHCRQIYALIPPHEYHLCGAKDLVEDDEPFCMSEEARNEREDRWFRQMLTTDQQLQAINTVFPLGIEDVSPYTQYVLRSGPTATQHHKQLGRECNPDDIDWRELNPRYLTEYGLWICTSYLLPASVTDTRYHQHQTSSPFQPSYGPFKVGTHSCKPKTGLCKLCGRYHAHKAGREVLYHARVWLGPMLEDASLPHTKVLSRINPEHGEHVPLDDRDEEGDSFMSED